MEIKGRQTLGDRRERLIISAILEKEDFKQKVKHHLLGLL